MARRSEQVVSGSRLRLARAFAGLSLAELEKRVGVSHQFLSDLETEQKKPTELLVEVIAEVCGLLPAFFYGPALDEFRDEECHFRRRQSTPVAVRSRVLAHGSLFAQLVHYCDSNLSLPAINIPSIRVRDREEIERAAERCRAEWGLDRDLPVKNMTRTIERAGVVVTRFEGAAEKVDAFSRGARRPVVVLNTDKGSTSRTRFDMAHECGHLVMHGGLVTGDPDREKEADSFASALLLPRTGFVREFPRTPRLDWPGLFEFKKRWGVSVAAIVRRAYDLRLIDAVRYQSAYKYMSMKGWHKGEPAEPPPESSEILPIAMKALRRQGIKERDLAGILGWTTETFTRVTGVQVPDEASEAEEAPLPGKVLRFPVKARRE
jgi:Zn-dependent peptidase ImmA (M78 family)/DNA-binding XRE family transcriptional regulator